MVEKDANNPKRLHRLDVRIRFAYFIYIISLSRVSFEPTTT